MSGIHSVTAFADDRGEVEITTEYDRRDTGWPFTVWINTNSSHLHIHMSERQFIKLKNSILSLDRQREEAKKQNA